MNAVLDDLRARQPGVLVQRRSRGLFPARPLVMRCGAFGDIVLLTVLLRQLHQRFGQPVDVIASGPWTRPLLSGHSALGELYIIRSRRTPYWLSRAQWRLVRWLRDRGPTPTWFCDHHVGRDLLSRGGIPADYIHDLGPIDLAARQSFADIYIRAANASPPAFEGLLPPRIAALERAAHLELDPVADRKLDGWLHSRGLGDRGWVVVHPGWGRLARHRISTRCRSGKHWPEERWARVLQAIHDTLPHYAIILSGTRREHAFNADIARAACIGGVHNVAGELPIPILLPLLARADSMVATDTGPAHAAAALGCPTVALFGQADPCLYRPGGSTTPAVALSARLGQEPSILGIPAQMVIAAWVNLRAAYGRRRAETPRGAA